MGPWHAGPTYALIPRAYRLLDLGPTAVHSQFVPITPENLVPGRMYRKIAITCDSGSIGQCRSAIGTPVVLPSVALR